ncbi:hypothetical protein CKA32_005637 [Geitlerinema sp. FC II]|nr:hypothetical protein CKA32_005637 [Geitlerinema sp. FC II]
MQTSISILYLQVLQLLLGDLMEVFLQESDTSEILLDILCYVDWGASRFGRYMTIDC